MKATVENNVGNPRSGDSLLSLRRGAIVTSTTPIPPPGEVTSRLLLSPGLTVPPNNVDDASTDGFNPFSFLTLPSSGLLICTDAPVQRPAPAARGVLSNNMSGRVGDETMRRKLVPIIQQAVRIIDEGATGGSQNDEI